MQPCHDLSPGQAHIWFADLDAWLPALGHCTSISSAIEKERAAGFRNPPQRDRYLLTRGILRSLITRYEPGIPETITFDHNAHGKPSLKDSALQFNLSHTGPFAVFAFTRDAAIGVDIEQIRQDMQRRDDIAARHFAPGECAALRATPPEKQNEAFFRCWTRKESFVKARGDGIFGGLQNFEVSVGPERPHVLNVDGDVTAAKGWSLFDLPLIGGCLGAVAIAAPGISIAFETAKIKHVLR